LKKRLFIFLFFGNGNCIQENIIKRRIGVGGKAIKVPWSGNNLSAAS
jgi:hypothetical protein